MNWRDALDPTRAGGVDSIDNWLGLAAETLHGDPPGEGVDTYRLIDWQGFPQTCQRAQALPHPDVCAGRWIAGSQPLASVRAPGWCCSVAEMQAAVDHGAPGPNGCTYASPPAPSRDWCAP
jgi:hypothetical protein